PPEEPMMPAAIRLEDVRNAEDACQPQRVLIVDENELIQVGLRAVLSDAPWVAASYLAGTVDEALAVIRRQYPQIVVVSATLGGRSGTDLCQWLKEHAPHVKVVLTSAEGRIPAALAGSLGAVGALSKHMPRAVLAAAIK